MRSRRSFRGQPKDDDRFTPTASAFPRKRRHAFQWVADPALLVQRWEVPLPEAPDGIAIIRFDESRGTYLQHYFDSRGVARVYEMTFSGGVWTLSRTTADPSPLEFSQHFTGAFDADGNTITGRWEISRDGSHGEHDFDLVYTRSGVEPLVLGPRDERLPVHP